MNKPEKQQSNPPFPFSAKLSHENVSKNRNLEVNGFNGFIDLMGKQTKYKNNIIAYKHPLNQ